MNKLSTKWLSKQFGTLIVSIFSLIMFIGFVLLIIDIDNYIYIVSIFIFTPIAAIFLFYQLTIEVTIEKIYVKLGVGLINKTILIKSIESIHPMDTSGLVGWGYRVMPDYTMLNVTGTRGVEIKFKGKTRKLRLGVKDAEGLTKCVSNLINK